MESVFNSIDECLMVLDSENNIQFCNESLLEKLKYNLSEVVNKSIFKLTNNKIELDKNKIISIYDKENNIYNFTYKIVNSEWKEKKSKVIIMKNINKYIMEDLELVLENIPLIIWIKDLTGRYIYANGTYCEKFNLNKEEIIGKRDRDIWDEDEAKISENEDKLILEKKITIVNEEHLRINNRRLLFCVVKSAIIDKDGSVKYTYGMAEDITEYKKIEERKKLLEKKREEDLVRNDFLNNMSHEFKTPLNVVLSTVQLLNNYIKNKDVHNIDEIRLKEYIGMIERNSYRLLRLTDNLIDITKIDNGDCTLSLENNNIISTVENIVLSVSEYVENMGGEIIFDTNVEEKIVSYDYDKIEKVILNLLSNSIKHNTDNTKINVNINAYEDNVKISVKDNGIGIAQDKLNIIFEKFVQEDNSLSREREGSGLGLALVKSLVEMHNGTVEANSELGKGSEFIITLPVRQLLKGEQLKFNICKQTIFEKCMIELSDIYGI